jgi:hypothetical protein
MSPADALRWMPAVRVDDDVATGVAHGRVLPVELVAPGDGPVDRWRVLGPDGQLLAVYRPHRGGTARPDVVLVGS